VTPTAPRFLPLFLAALVVRAGTVALGAWLAAQPPRVIVPDDPAAVEVRQRVSESGARAVEPWFRWDAVWMANVGRHGYSGAADRGGRLGVAFMPAVPATFAAAEALGLNPFWSVLAVVNLAGAAGAALFAQVAARLLNDRAAGLRAFALLLAFPTAFFYSAPYNESFGLLFTAVALAAWLANRPALAGAGALGGSLARLTGVGLGVAAAIDWLLNRDRRELRRAAAVVAGSFAGLALFWGFLWWAVGDPLAGLKSHAMWGRRDFSVWNPLYAIESVYDPHLSRPDRATHFGWEALTVVVSAALGVRAWRKRGAFWGLIVLVPLAQMFASGTLLSANRVILAALPAFVELADLLRVRVAFFAASLGLAFAQLLLLSRFVHWQFAG
jgi:hypothetical protein